MSSNPPDFINDIMVHHQASEHVMGLADQSMVALGMLEADALAAVSSLPPIEARRVAVLAADGVDEAHVAVVQQSLEAAGARVNVVSRRHGFLQGLAGGKLMVDHCWLDMPSVMFDAVFIPSGAESIAVLSQDEDALHFVQEAYAHGKALAATGDGVGLLKTVGVVLPSPECSEPACQGIVTDLHNTPLEVLSDSFIEAIVKDRHWRRTDGETSPIH